MDTVDALAFHRGFMHSILFFIMFSPVLGWVISRIHKNTGAGWLQWANLMFWGLFTHSLLDCFTTWGTQLFWPFGNRISIKSIFVIDPLYTLPFLVLLLIVMFKKQGSPARTKLNNIALIISSLYLLFTVINKQYINLQFEKAFARQNINLMRYETKPTPLNNILWASNAETKDGYYISYYSLLDKNLPGQFNYFAKNHHLINHLENEPQVKKLLWITEGFYTIEPWKKGFIMNDLRFGQTDGWQQGTGNFVFAYQLDTTHGLHISQRKNSVKTGGKMLKQFWQRILGR